MIGRSMKHAHYFKTRARAYYSGQTFLRSVYIVCYYLSTFTMLVIAKYII